MFQTLLTEPWDFIKEMKKKKKKKKSEVARQRGVPGGTFL